MPMNGCELSTLAVDPRPSTERTENRYETGVQTESLLEASYDHSIAIPVGLAVRGIKRVGIDAIGSFCQSLRARDRTACQTFRRPHLSDDTRCD